MSFRACFGLILFLTLASRLFAAPPDRLLVKDGRAAATIIVEGGEPKSQRAAEALQNYIEKITQVKLPLVVETELPATNVPGTRLLVGHTRRAKALGAAIPHGYDPTIRPGLFAEEGYVLKTVGDDVIIAGNNDGPYKGTIFAVYAILERFGCRWYFPGEWGEEIPQVNVLAVEHLDIVSAPDFPIRNIWLSGWIPVSKEERKIYADWCEKIGFNDNSFYPRTGDGYLGILLPEKEYWSTHPEFYALGKDGQRHVGKMDRTTMLCLSNPEVLRQSQENLRAAFAGERKMANVSDNGFGINPPDGTPYCYCDECRRASQNFRYPTYIHETMTSEEFFGFAAQLARTFPDKLCATMAYALREMPPQGVDLPPNISVACAPISSDVLHPNDSQLWRRAESLRILKQWCERTPHVIMRDYNPGLLTGMFVPDRAAANIAVNAPIYKQIGVNGVVTEGRKAFMQTWLSYYLTAKLMWNAKADVEATKSEFYARFFGPQAGPSVQAWWDACEKQLASDTTQAHEDFLINHLYSSRFVNSIRPYANAALAADATPQQKERLTVFGMIADHLGAFAEMTDAERDMNWHAAAGAATKARELQQKLHDTYSFLIDHHTNRKSRAFFAEGRRIGFETNLAKTNGTTGEHVANLPLQMHFQRDPFNEGVVSEWYKIDHDDSTWKTLDTFLVWDQQEPPLDKAGHDYDGYGWYRESVEIPAKFKGKPVSFYCGGAINEAWVWINGKYAGHKAHDLWWSHANDFELDVTQYVRPGEQNQITVRVWNDAEIGGLYRRGFFWSPNSTVAVKTN